MKHPELLIHAYIETFNTKDNNLISLELNYLPL